jgi:hypothetical protein
MARISSEVYLVIRLRLRKLGEPLRLGIDGERLRLDRLEERRLLELEDDEEDEAELRE